MGKNSPIAEIGASKRRFGLAEDAPVASCYEAGHDTQSHFRIAPVSALVAILA
jgi:hypothetical protein